MAKSADVTAGDNAAMALSPFRYDQDMLVRGEVFVLQGFPNDHLLLGMDYIRPVEKGTLLLECGECGATFLDEDARERHGRHFHDQWCDCGWRPPPDVYDKDQAMGQHIKDCDVWREDRNRASQRHLKKALEAAA